MPAATDKATEDRIRKLVADWTKALSAKDARRVLSFYEKDVVQYLLAPPLKYEDPTAGNLQQWFDTWKGPIGYETQDLSVAADGNVAFVHGLAHMHGEKADGEKPDLWIRLTLGLSRRGDDWKIVLEHESVPFYMDGSYRAAVDLRP